MLGGYCFAVREVITVGSLGAVSGAVKEGLDAFLDLVVVLFLVAVKEVCFFVCCKRGGLDLVGVLFRVGTVREVLGYPPPAT